MFIQILILLLSLITLVWSADKFVFGASALARNLGISPMIIGLTIVAMGSSAPEMMIAVTASLQGNVDTAVGNAIGSNITNIALVLGLTALFHPLSVSSTTIKREIPLILVVTAIATYMLANSNFSFNEGLILIIGFVLYIATLLVVTLRRAKQNPIDDKMVLEAEQEVPDGVSTKQSVIWLVVGMILLPLSASFLVDSSIFIAKAFGISDLVIGLTVIAIGTSLPELAASIMSIIKKEDDLALGNIIGSNIFNILAVLSLAGLIAPGDIDNAAAVRDAPFMLATTFLLFILCFSRGGKFRITRAKGLLLLAVFIGYQVLLFSQINR
ncbi:MULTISPECIES: calcium/sodium antiporter [unclassified Colwellia]|uniref:calcium/sodium antiporter n=1 Tax=unclassified Colwellia TaxID=196834 RepID=UPI0015F50326|nr:MULTISPECIES: calcium/sodium antiporter [unclassified Colwellia]MBA6223679.1 calcium/sodium antiporter [Colwellia sp. MB3u-45]MBA6268409.1 calcium/sodium antiporter [Colwellia sp. MB3u-43]MBA6288018.1 calcium/sodium antiporter [Colwellia sp. MB3u-4]MBA6297682.1 calcium/sodium antiporter [Colwellia sp. MB02u-9]MBA6319860.1 calcium/sodium antiporter [Colwellia sp. MB02u-19]